VKEKGARIREQEKTKKRAHPILLLAPFSGMSSIGLSLAVSKVSKA
jgi:hypothetical protein